MKKGLLFTLICIVALFAFAMSASAADVEINETNFPDANFRSYVTTNFDKGRDGRLSDAEIAAVTSINVYDDNISTLKGIEYFTALTYLNCMYNNLTTLDVSGNPKLITLYCDFCDITSLNVRNCPALETLYCNNNNITQIDISENLALQTLEIIDNQLTSIDTSNNKALRVLLAFGNKLTTLDVSQNTELTGLKCMQNQLTTLDVSKNTKLDYLQCSQNQLTALNVSKNTELRVLHCDQNQLTTLDVSKNTKLSSLYCYGNQLTSLDLSNNVDLSYFNENTYTSSFYPFNYYYVDTVDKLFDLTTLPAGFDPSKASDWSYDATVNGNILSFGYGNSTKYTYRCSDTYTAEFWLSINENLTTINATNFPDANFRAYVAKNIDTNHDGMLSAAECTAITTIDVSNSNIRSLTGIEYFTKLESLNCSNNQLTALNVSSCTALTTLGCANNRFEIGTVNHTFDLTTLPGNFDVSKASGWVGCTVDGNILTVNSDVTEVIYTYDCGNSRSTTFTLNVHEHTGGTATCKDLAICTTCHAPYGELDASNHVGGTCEENAYAPTCTDVGYSGDICCAGCGQKLADGTVIAALGHKGVIDKAVAPSCTETGLTAGSHCANCGLVYVAQQEVAALGHTSEIAPETAVAPTCTVSGKEADTVCEVCGITLTTGGALDALGHTEVIDAAVAPTCAKKGLTEGSHCSVCGFVFVAQTEIATVPHTGVMDDEVDPTCTTVGYTMGSHCSTCGEVFVAQDEIPALGHTGGTATADSLAICDRCHQPYGQAALGGSTVSLGDALGANFYMEVDPVISSDPNAYFRLTVDGVATTIPMSEATTQTEGGVEYYVFTGNIFAMQMTEEITVQMYNADGNAVSETYSYTVAEYATTIANNASGLYSADAVALAKALLNYGAAAQTHFGVNTTALANAGLNAADKTDTTALNDEELADLGAYALASTGTVSGITYAGNTVTLDANLRIQHYFTLQAGTIDDYTFMLDDVALTPKYSAKYAMYYVEIADITSDMLQHTFKVTVSSTSGAETQTIDYSVYSYVCSVKRMPEHYDEKVQNVVNALYRYGKAAFAYVANK